WTDSYNALRQQLSFLLAIRPAAAEWVLIFEYELPRERGRRPDLVLLSNTAILVIEFKQLATAIPAHLDQVAAYARDLANYHGASQAHPLRAILVPTKAKGATDELSSDDVLVVSPEALATVLDRLNPTSNDSVIDADSWINAEYAPLPSLIEAARRIFAH